LELKKMMGDVIHGLRQVEGKMKSVGSDPEAIKKIETSLGLIKKVERDLVVLPEVTAQATSSKLLPELILRIEDMHKSVMDNTGRLDEISTSAISNTTSIINSITSASASQRSELLQ
jgi:hypothetical protein